MPADSTPPNPSDRDRRGRCTGATDRSSWRSAPVHHGAARALARPHGRDRCRCSPCCSPSSACSGRSPKMYYVYRTRWPSRRDRPVGRHAPSERSGSGRARPSGAPRSMSGHRHDPMHVRIEGPSPAMAVAVDLARRSLWLAARGRVRLARPSGASTASASTLYALAIVVVNFLLVGLAAGGHRPHQRRAHGRRRAVRLPAAPRADLPRRAAGAGRPLGRAGAARASRSIVTHLVLLFWEMRYVSASLAFPGLKPAAERQPVSRHVPDERPIATSRPRRTRSRRSPPHVGFQTLAGHLSSSPPKKVVAVSSSRRSNLIVKWPAAFGEDTLVRVQQDRA